MKIIIPKDVHNTEILNEKGENIISSLHVRKINISASVDEPCIAELEVFFAGVEAVPVGVEYIVGPFRGVAKIVMDDGTVHDLHAIARGEPVADPATPEPVEMTLACSRCERVFKSLEVDAECRRCKKSDCVAIATPEEIENFPEMVGPR